MCLRIEFEFDMLLYMTAVRNAQRDMPLNIFVSNMVPNSIEQGKDVRHMQLLG